MDTAQRQSASASGTGSPLAFSRVLLKISGEGLCRFGRFGVDAEELSRIAEEIKGVRQLGVQLALVIGGGNFIRGSELAQRIKIEEVAAHYMGMLGTVINALAIQEVLESIGVDTRVQSAIAIDRVCEKFVRRRAIRHLEKGRVVIFAAGTGNPFVTTDTCGALRASEIGADALLKATKVDGVYTSDPVKNADAKLHRYLTYNEVIDKRLAIMDLSAIVMCQQQKIPILVFNLRVPGQMQAVVEGQPIGTLISDQVPSD